MALVGLVLLAQFPPFALAVSSDSLDPETTLTPHDDPQLAGSRRIARWSLFSEQSEQAYGAEIVMRLNESLPMDPDASRRSYLQGVLDKLAAPDHSDAVTRFKVYVIDSPYIGSFYAPGGFVYVTTGTLAQCESEAEVAALLAHQVGHVARRHWAAKQSRRILAGHASIPVMFFVPYFGLTYPQVTDLVMRWYVNAMPRGEEKEADSLGAQYLYNAGYDPAAALSIRRRLHDYLTQHPGWAAPVLLSCLPNEERLNLMAAKIELYPPRAESLLTTSDFESFLESLKNYRSPQAEENLLKFKSSFGLLTREEQARLSEINAAYREQAKEQLKQQGLRRTPPVVSLLVRVGGVFRRNKQDASGNDVAYGLYYFRALQASNPTLDDPKVLEYVNRLAQNVARQSGVGIPLQVTILRDPAILAGAFPGGFLYVSQGAIQASDSEAQLAGVLAHEIAHVQCRHWHKERMRAFEWAWGTLPLLFAEGTTVPYGAFFGSALAWKYGRPVVLAGMTRKDEAKADELAVRYLVASGYDPEGYSEMLQKIFDRERAQPYHLPRIYMDHPDTLRRVARTRQDAAAVHSPKPLLVTTDEFASVQEHLGNVLRYGDDREVDEKSQGGQTPAQPPLLSR